MSDVPWTETINFASALLLHSCLTVLLKETLNILEVTRRLFLRFRYLRQKPFVADASRDIQCSVVLDAYISIMSNDRDGELAELYFTNTGFILLAVSLASSVTMNILLSSLTLNIIVASTFVLAFLASLGNNKRDLAMPILALRRAGRFIWSDTPFVNFFSLIYIATVLHGQSSLRLKDYITFRSIAVLELVFMKAKIAASTPEMQIELARRLVATEWVALRAIPSPRPPSKPIPLAERHAMIPFTTHQRLSLMLLKSTITFDLGSLQGPLGPATCPLPLEGYFVDLAPQGWKIYRIADDVMVIADCFSQTSPKSLWMRFLQRAHGVLLRRLGKQRVIYLLRTNINNPVREDLRWHANVNLVTGISKKWLEEGFRQMQAREVCLVA